MDAHSPDQTVTAYKIPLSIIAKWPKPNFVDPDRRQWFTPYVIVLHVAATIIVWTRIWTRVRREAGGFGADDALIIGAWVSPLIYTNPSKYNH
jgi:hypothetical protein